MSNEEIISVIDELALGAEECANDYDYAVRARKSHARKAKALREAIALIRDNPDNQINEPLRWRSKKEQPPKKGRYEVVCRNGEIPPYVMLGFYDPDNRGWDLYGVTHWRPLPEPPKEV